jgi:hypothetical protein
VKILTKFYKLEDSRGNGQPGYTVTAYPTGTVSNGTAAADLTLGKYLWEIDSSSDNAKVARFYDIYVGAVMYEEKVDIGLWSWEASDKEINEEETIAFSSLTDENGDALPTTITNCKIELQAKADRAGHVSAQTTTGFTITLGSAGDASIGVFDIRIHKTK